MAYATQNDLVDAAGGAAAFLQLTDIDDDGVADADVVTRAQAAAEGWINSFLGRYALPIASPTPELRRLAAAETIYQVRAAKPAAAISEFDKEARRDRLTQLKAYQSGSLRPDLAGNLASTGRAAIVTGEDAGATVTRKTWDNG